MALNIAGSDESPLRVLAGPGTGKTYAMKRRVMRLLEEGGVPQRILACTFTRTAARDIAREIAELGVEGAELVWAGTLHGLCFSILQRNEVLAATGRVARPLAASEERFLLQDLRAFGGVREAEKKLEAFGAAWARLQSDDPGWPQDAQDQAFQAALLTWLTFHGAMLIGEMVPVTLAYMRNNPLCDERTQFEHVIVDEFQDLNRAEQVLVDLLAEHGSLNVIGDEDQSIYSFKHAHPEGIVTFADAHPGTHDETLNVCRRCPTTVVTLSNNLITHNQTASGRPLQPQQENGAGNVQIVQWASMDAEAQGIAQYVVQRIEHGDVSAGQVLILAPRRQLGYAVRDSLLEAGVVAHSFFNEQALDGNPKALDACQAQEMYALLTLLAEPEDRVALRCWCGFGSDGLGEAGWRRIRARCEETGDSPRTVLEQLAEGQITIAHTGSLVQRYVLLRQQEAAMGALHGHTLAEALFPDGQEWAEPLRTIVTSSFPATMEFDAEDLLQEVRAGVTQMETPTDVDFVRVMSLHKSKGLTAKLVVVMGCIEGMIPRIDYTASHADRQRSLEEQRRLFYVALTRTTETLILSSVTHIPVQQAFQMGLGVAGGQVQASRFINELGPTRPAPIAGDALV
ncbi:MAG: ATP-dependent helicase [Acidobacteria bacterium]|nr:ATP-dependent helicase [Acidobacteriota bacterium]